MKSLRIPSDFNYIGIFLTFACNMRCSYCINSHGELAKRKPMPGADFIKGINRIKARVDLPVTLGGGEPTCHPEFYEIVRGIRPDLNIDLLTNGMFDGLKFKENIAPERLSRPAPYASIRVSYHPKEHNLIDLLYRVNWLRTEGYDVGVWAVDHPEAHKDIEIASRLAHRYGIDFRVKEFLGVHKGTLYGTYKYPGSVNGPKQMCECKTSELLIGPQGYLYKCHRDLYAGENAYGHILNKEIPDLAQWRACRHFGECNPCDLKVKFNRYQQFGHCSVEIKDIG